MESPIINEDLAMQDSFDLIMECTKVDDNDDIITEGVVEEGAASTAKKKFELENEKSYTRLKAISNELKKSRKEMSPEEVHEKVTEVRGLIKELTTEIEKLPDDDMNDRFAHLFKGIRVVTVTILGLMFPHLTGLYAVGKYLTNRTITKDILLKELSKMEKSFAKAEAEVEKKTVGKIEESVSMSPELRFFVNAGITYEGTLATIDTYKTFGQISESVADELVTELVNCYESALEEFSIGAMLPQGGSTDGVGDPDTVMDNIKNLNSNIDDDACIPELTEEDVNNIINLQMYGGDAITEASIIDSLKEKINDRNLSFKARRLISRKVSLNIALKKAIRHKEDKAKIKDIKRDIIVNTKSLRELKKNLDTDDVKKMNEYEADLTKAMEIADSMDRAAEAKKKKQKKVVKESVDEEILIETAKIEEEMKPIIDKLNSKGFKTKYSSPGHTKLRKRPDQDKDGVYYGKLYSDARIMFDDDYDFPSAPKYWEWRTVDGKDYLDIVPISYSEKDGSPDEAFSKWKTNYMNSLENWVDDLGKKSEKKTEKDVTESVNEMYESVYTDVVSDLYLDLMD